MVHAIHYTSRVKIIIVIKVFSVIRNLQQFGFIILIFVPWGRRKCQMVDSIKMEGKYVTTKRVAQERFSGGFSRTYLKDRIPLMTMTNWTHIEHLYIFWTLPIILYCNFSHCKYNTTLHWTITVLIFHKYYGILNVLCDRHKLILLKTVKLKKTCIILHIILFNCIEIRYELHVRQLKERRVPFGVVIVGQLQGDFFAQQVAQPSSLLAIICK